MEGQNQSSLTSIEDFKGVHEGKRIYILASGPSLEQCDLSRLKNKMVMGLNRSVLAYPDTHYHCVMDQRLFDLHGEDLKKTRFLFTMENRPWGIPIKLLGSQGFSWDLAEGIYSGFTVSYWALQVAVYMGFKEVVFLGLDLKLDKGRTHFFGQDFHSMNHENTEFPRMVKMLEYGAEQLKGKDVKVYNCSPITNLECFERVTYDYAVSL